MVKGVCIIHGGDISKPFGGTHRVVTFAKALRDAGLLVHLVVPKPSSSFPEGIDGIHIHTVPVGEKGTMDEALRGLFVLLKGERVAKTSRCVVQIEHSSLAGLATLIGYSVFGYVVDVHDLSFDDPRYLDLVPISIFPKLIGRSMYELEKGGVSRASKIIAVSEPMKEFFVKEWGIPEERIEVIPNGCFAEKLDKFKEGVEEEGSIGLIGGLSYKVDHDKIIRLAKEVREIKKIYVIGDGPMRHKFLRRLREERINKVIVTGYLPHEVAYGILARSQVCILPLRDTFHTRVAMHIRMLEYAVLGKAIAADRDATARILEQHNAALVSDPSDPDEFVENVRRLLEDENLRRRLGENARRLAKEFTWEKQGKKLVKIYEEFIEDV
jgi:glycosyltransferase involved in cell wall biosynthesis